MAEKAFLLDTTKCMGCRACQVACKQWNDLPGEATDFFAGPEYTNPAELSAITWNHVKFFEIDRSNEEHPVWQIMHKKCYHCEQANCMTVCPEHAISRRDGWVVIDQDKCIGCGACVNECIYKVPHISRTDYKSHKCNACTVHKRDIPACAFACPTNALMYGNRFEMLHEAESRLRKYKQAQFPNASLYGRDQFGGLNMLVILKDRPSKFGLEENPVPISMAQAEQIRDTYAMLSLFTFGLPSLKRVAFRISKSLSSAPKESRIS